ncbi:MAG: nucleotidyltransferase family protein [Nitrospira sp.]|nr:nucleotidyltransferase family protein [bacterium]MBL7050173.1 nucleotidyltransferase family protein [Nitrospira sp.]
MKTLEEIRLLIENSRNELSNKYFVKDIGIFGSYVRGDQSKQSDLDILVEFEKPIGFFQFLDLEGLTGVKIDLGTKKALKPVIGKNILQELVSL